MIRITGTLHADLPTFVIILRLTLLRMKKFRTKLVEKIKTHNLHTTILFFEICADYGIMWQRIVQPDRRTFTNIIRRISFKFRITKAANTVSEYVIHFCFTTAAKVALTRLKVTFQRTVPVPDNASVDGPGQAACNKGATRK